MKKVNLEYKEYMREAVALGQNVLTYHFGLRDGFNEYEVDLVAMTQTNKTSGKVRKIRRWVLLDPFPVVQ